MLINNLVYLKNVKWVLLNIGRGCIEEGSNHQFIGDKLNGISDIPDIQVM
jgi:hypothetical protein